MAKVYSNELTSSEELYSSLYGKYFITMDDLPDTPDWRNTQWNDDFEKAKFQGKEFIVSMKSNIIYRIKNEDAVENVSKLQTFSEVQNFALNAKLRRCFRRSWLLEDRRIYIQYFSPVCQGMETIRILDSDNGTHLPLKPFLMLKNEEDMFCPYNPSNDDLFADDWIIDGFSLVELRNDTITELVKLGCKVVDVNDLNDLGVEEHE